MSARGKGLAVWMNGHLVGNWSFRSSEHSFAYEPEWLAQPFRRPISLSMPLRGPAAPYRGPVVANFFDNLLPDSSLVRTQLQRRLGTDSKEPLALLEHLGKDCLGALQLLPFGVEGEEPKRIEGEEIQETEIADVLRQLPQFPMGVGGDSHLRLSLAGNHEKTALLRHDGRWLKPRGATPTTHIFKLPIGVTEEGFDLSESVANEWLCHRILQGFGLHVASAEMMTFEDQRCLVVTRFDRLLRASGEGLLRLPHEDFCQATGTPPAFKYEVDGGPGVKKCLALLAGAKDPAKDKENFFKTQLLFWILCAIDGHAKNFSLAILPLGRFEMAPLYDVLSAYPILGQGKGKLARQHTTMAMAVWGKNRHYHWLRIAKRHWIKTAADCGIIEGEQLIETVVSQAESVISNVAKELDDDFPPTISEPIFEGILKACKGLR